MSAMEGRRTRRAGPAENIYIGLGDKPLDESGEPLKIEPSKVKKSTKSTKIEKSTKNATPPNSTPAAAVRKTRTTRRGPVEPENVPEPEPISDWEADGEETEAPPSTQKKQPKKLPRPTSKLQQITTETSVPTSTFINPKSLRNTRNKTSTKGIDQYDFVETEPEQTTRRSTRGKEALPTSSLEQSRPKDLEPKKQAKSDKDVMSKLFGNKKVLERKSPRNSKVKTKPVENETQGTIIVQSHTSNDKVMSDVEEDIEIGHIEVEDQASEGILEDEEIHVEQETIEEKDPEQESEIEEVQEIIPPKRKGRPPGRKNNKPAVDIKGKDTIPQVTQTQGLRRGRQRQPPKEKTPSEEASNFEPENVQEEAISEEIEEIEEPPVEDEVVEIPQPEQTKIFQKRQKSKAVIESETESENELSNNMTLHSFSKNFVKNSKSILKEFQGLIKDIDGNRRSMKKRLTILPEKVFQAVDELDTYDNYWEVYVRYRERHKYYRDKQIPLPDDPFEDPYASDFDEQDPGVQGLFKSEEEKTHSISELRVYEADLESAQQSNLSLISEVGKLLTSLEVNQRKLIHEANFVTDLIRHEKKVKKSYIAERNARKQQAVVAMQRYGRGSSPRPQEYQYDYIDLEQTYGKTDNGLQEAFSSPSRAQPEPINKKRKLPWQPDAPRASKQVRVQQANGIVEETRDYPLEVDMNIPDVEYDENELPSTPVERVEVEGFGDHTPGRSRKYQHPEEVVDGGDVGDVLADSEWNREELLTLLEALAADKNYPGKWIRIKKKYGTGSGSELERRSAKDIQTRALEIRQILRDERKPIPPWWDNFDEW